MALSSPVITKFPNAMAIKDGTGTPLKLNPILLTMGDFQISDLSPDQREMVEVFVRGVYNSTHKGQAVLPTFSFSAKLADLTDLTVTVVGTLLDFFHATSTTFASRISTMNTSTNKKGNATGFDFCWIIERTEFQDDSDQFLYARDCTITYSIDESPDDGVVLSVSGVIHGGVTRVETLPTGF